MDLFWGFGLVMGHIPKKISYRRDHSLKTSVRCYAAIIHLCGEQLHVVILIIIIIVMIHVYIYMLIIIIITIIIVIIFITVIDVYVCAYVLCI